jgi:hypothetical protein
MRSQRQTPFMHFIRRHIVCLLSSFTYYYCSNQIQHLHITAMSKKIVGRDEEEGRRKTTRRPLRAGTKRQPAQEHHELCDHGRPKVDEEERWKGDK